MDGGLASSIEEMQMQQQQQAANEERRKMILDQILEPAARERLSRLRLVRADTARAVEDALITGATNGRLTSKLTEAQLISMLEQYGAGKGPVTGEGAGNGGRGVKIQRRRYNGLDEDDDDNDDDLM